MNYKEPVIIIAAARSGTKMLRNVLSVSEEIAGYPYDANYIWKYGNYKNKHDQISPDSISEHKKEKIRKFFFKICKIESKPRILEKSVSNSLRIPFVRSIFPECKIIHLYRNGYDVVADARLCWQASARSERIQDKKDRVRKLKEFPFTMAWPYLLEYTKNYTKKMIFNKEYVESWGPRYIGIDDDVECKNLIEVCALQWGRCVEHCSNELGKIDKDKDYINVSYESLVSKPGDELGRIADFLGIADGKKIIAKGNEAIKSDFVEEWRKYLSTDEHKMISGVIDSNQNLITKLLAP